MKAIQDKGYQCIRADTFQAGYKHVVFGADSLRQLPVDSIIVNTEQLKLTVNPCYLELLRKSTISIHWLGLHLEDHYNVPPFTYWFLQR